RSQQTATGLENTPDDVRQLCLEEFQQLRKAKLLEFGQWKAADLAAQAKGLLRFGDPAGLARAAHAAIAEVADSLKDRAPNLALVLRQAPAGQPPLLASVFAFFFR